MTSVLHGLPDSEGSKRAARRRPGRNGPRCGAAVTGERFTWRDPP
ncbi:hypothetical protein BURMUCGD2M_5761 [Burkholderia multivorans CGD2M]|uniref:Uncharacterized protein n=1 Tax=Burkholderia multivorans CGD2 TaxID=513052 RepID=B9BL13_9BURK|nr:hypothetical protein BURMUCGD2_5771 [Burkholderia multivorans CGD2]EEE16316.1 hypothetical protein BURMUCGD2M_5761 [Burkholderia multivorans CGD2M]